VFISEAVKQRDVHSQNHIYIVKLSGKYLHYGGNRLQYHPFAFTATHQKKHLPNHRGLR
jgi:hypothetical protein